MGDAGGEDLQLGVSVDLRSPSINGANDIVTSLQGSDVKPSVNDALNPVTVVTDLNAPVVTPVGARQRKAAAAAPRPSSSAGTLGKTKAAKAKSAKRVRGPGKSVSAPTSPSEVRRSSPKRLPTSKKGNAGAKPGDAKLRVVSQRENHIWSERERRKGMNYLFNTLRSLLPHPVDKTDKSTVVGEIIKYIQSLQVKLEVMTTKQQVMLATRTGGFSSSTASGSEPLSKVLVANGLTLVDHSSDPMSMTAITALPPPGKESCLQSFLGTNVGIHVCGRNVFITTSSPRGRRGLFQELLLAIHKYDLDIINATISTSNASIFHCLHCQTSLDTELLNHDLHSALQRVIANYGSQFYEP